MFKNARIFRLAAESAPAGAAVHWQLSARRPPTLAQVEDLNARLARRAFRPCGPLEQMTLGWVPPLTGGSALVHVIDGQLLFAARRQERVLPGAVLREAVLERIAQIERSEARVVRRRERTRLRDALRIELLPRAFTRSRVVRVWLAPAEGWAVLDTASAARAEETLSLLRLTLDSLPVTPPRPTVPPSARLTAWVADGIPEAGLTLGDRCVLRDPADRSALVRCRGMELTDPEIQGHLAAGKQVVMLGLIWHEQLTFTLDAQLALTGLRWLESEESANDGGDAQRREEAAFLALTEVLRPLFTTLITAFAWE